MGRARHIARTTAPCWLLAAALVSISGCEQSDLAQRCRIEGQLKINGRPAELALITFVPIAPTAGPKASGLARQGSYVIEQQDGPYPGEFLVKIENVPLEIEAIAAGRTNMQRTPTSGKPRPTVLAKYNRDSTTTVTVQHGKENRFDFEVKATSTTYQRGRQ